MRRKEGAQDRKRKEDFRNKVSRKGIRKHSKEVERVNTLKE